MNDVTVFNNANLPSVEKLSQALKNLDRVHAGTGMAILKMDRTGHWVFGADQTEVEETSTWAANPFSLVHGWIAWGSGEVLGEVMASMFDPMPDVGPVPAGAEKGWEEQVGVNFKCLSGEDKGLEVSFRVTSKGGKGAIQQLGRAIQAQLDKDQSRTVPIVRLKKEHYNHKSYGRIYKPIFEIVSWMGVDGQTEEKPASEAPVDAPTRRRRGA